MAPAYKDIVLHYLTKLEYLDSTEINECDWKNIIEDLSQNVGPAQFIVKCYKIVGLQAPPKDKKNMQSIHLEFTLPLFESEHDDGLLQNNDSEEIIIEPKKQTEQEESVKGDKKGKKDKKKPDKQGPKASPYNKPNEYDEEIEKFNFSFKTERMSWSKIMEFPPLVIEPPGQNLMLLRDAFRTSVKVKVVFLKTKLQEKKKKKPQKETKAKGKNKKSETISINNSIASEKTEISKEIVVKQVNLAEFRCDLQNINWSDEFLDFYWADHPDLDKSKAMVVEGCLKDICYQEGKIPKSKEKKKKEEESAEMGKQVLPKIFTCQLGFGLRRKINFPFVSKDLFADQGKL